MITEREARIAGLTRARHSRAHARSRLALADSFDPQRLVEVVAPVTRAPVQMRVDVDASAASMPVSIRPRAPIGSKSSMPRTKVIYALPRSFGRHGGSNGYSTSNAIAIGSHSRLRTSTCAIVKTMPRPRLPIARARHHALRQVAGAVTVDLKQPLHDRTIRKGSSASLRVA